MKQTQDEIMDIAKRIQTHLRNAGVAVAQGNREEYAAQMGVIAKLAAAQEKVESE
ncbi:MAG: hypothetical protein ACR2PR_09340 [Pseudohongiellaceae bacterium]